MLAMVTAPDGSGATIHRTYLKDCKKAPVQSPKKLMQGMPIKGAAIRLFPVASILGVAEGIETALAAANLTGIPTWACVSAGGVESFIPPEEVVRVVIFADNDENFTGQAAAYKLANRLVMSGIEAEVRLPSVAGDWADVLRTR
jgi:putative DNA primase/helicase